MQLTSTLALLAFAAYAAAAGVAPPQGPCAECPSVDGWTLSSWCVSPGGEPSNTVCNYTQQPVEDTTDVGQTGYCRYEADGYLIESLNVECPDQVSYDNDVCPPCAS
ncbi:hypothetical protein HYDPIDRAFT_37874 [Hydnomerulius pinastri MD-312]|nr:hypothetical protein HYDPIDRAFT_37874 [Hydnomerulius pinastri MD-312]